VSHGVLLQNVRAKDEAMSEIVNLRRARKHKARVEAAQAADQARRLHGRTLAEKARDEQVAARREAALDGARIEKNDAKGKEGN